jgi:hypothetical protein
MTRTIARRLARLEYRYGHGTCTLCYGYPVRLVGIDEDTGAGISESLPASGCPACGRPIRSELHIVGIDPTAV